MPLWSLLLAACSPATPAPDGALVEVEDQAGLSDLAIDASGALWAVAERPAALVQIEPTALTLPIRGLPEGVEPEALSISPEGTVRIGTEGDGERAEDGLYTLIPTDTEATATDRVAFPWAPWGLVAAENQGVEAMCEGTSRWVAGEPVLVEQGRRLAPLARWTGSAWESLRLPLSTPNGKISALACDEDGSLWAIERHYEDLALLHVTVGEAVTVQTCALPAWLRDPEANWEGLTIDGDTLLWISDNQNATVRGPTLLARLARRCDPA